MKWSKTALIVTVASWALALTCFVAASIRFYDVVDPNPAPWNGPAQGEPQSVEPAGTAPPPYTDPNQTITNALGGFGRSQGWGVSTNSAAAKDLLADSVIPTNLHADVEAPTTTSAVRTVNVQFVCGSGDCAVGAQEAVCLRLGPDTNGPPAATPALACPNPDVADIATNGTGGCMLRALGDHCQFTIRPILSCNDYASCHTPIWARASVGSTVNAIVNVVEVW